MVTVHLTTAVVPATTPVTVVVGEAGVVIVAVPLTRVHRPVPTVGALWVMLKVDALHWVRLG